MHPGGSWRCLGCILEAPGSILEALRGVSEALGGVLEALGGSLGNSGTASKGLEKCDWNGEHLASSTTYYYHAVTRARIVTICLTQKDDALVALQSGCRASRRSTVKQHRSNQHLFG